VFEWIETVNWTYVLGVGVIWGVIEWYRESGEDD